MLAEQIHPLRPLILQLLNSLSFFSWIYCTTRNWLVGILKEKVLTLAKLYYFIHTNYFVGGLMESSIDSQLAQIIIENNIEKALELTEVLEPSLAKELIALFEDKDKNRDRWKAIVNTLLHANYFESAEAALFSSLPPQSSASDRAQLYEEIGRWYLSLGKTEKAGLKFSIATRLDSSKERVSRQARLLHTPLELKLKPPWKVITAINEQKLFNSLGDILLFPEISFDLCRNQFAKNFHNKIDLFLGELVDCSFLITWREQPVVRIECHIRGDHNILSCFEVPIIFATNPKISQEIICSAIPISYICLIKIAKYLGTVSVLHLEEDYVPVITPTSLMVDLLGGSPQRMDRISVDLTTDENLIFKNIRKGHKSNIKWGKTNLELTTWRSIDDDHLIDVYYRLHEITHRYPGFNDPGFLKKCLHDKSIELTAAMHNGVEKSVIITGIDGKNAYYMSSIGTREGGDALAHWPLYNSMLECKKRNIENFDLGYVHPERIQDVDDKLHQISHFKRGFVSGASRHVWWVIERNFQDATF